MNERLDVDRVFSEYVREHRDAGRADVAPYLDRVEASRRRELAALIDAYIARQPRRALEPDALAGSTAEEIVESLHSSLHGSAGMWPIVLPKLRHQAQLPDRELAPRLANELGVAGKEQKVARYYREMEAGLLPAAGVSDNVLQALARIVGTSPEVLRRAGSPLAAPEPAAPFAAAAPARVTATGAPSAAPDPWDEVDDLFRGGSR